MITIIAIWLAGSFAALGALKAISIVEQVNIDIEVYVMEFLKSWYAFAMIITMILVDKEKGNKTEENDNI